MEGAVLSVGAAICNKRTRLGLTAKEVAKRAHLSPSYVSKVENGECHPGNEPILTTAGYIPIAELDPAEHLLVSYQQGQDLIRRGGDKRRGYGFTRSVRPYVGEFLRVGTAASETVVTPNHHFTVRWSPEARDAWVVYLMNKGSWWRIGQTRLLRGGVSDGLRTRLKEETGDAAWVLGIFGTAHDAVFHEQLWSAQFGLPGLTWQPGRSRGHSFDVLEVARFFGGLDTGLAAKKALESFGLDPGLPFRRRGTRLAGATRWQTEAINLAPGYMEIPTDPGSGAKPVWLPFDVGRHWGNEDVFSLTVAPHHHYVADHTVVHNCEPSVRTFGAIAGALGMNSHEVWLAVMAEAATKLSQAPDRVDA